MYRRGCLVALAALFMGACEGGPWMDRTATIQDETPAAARSEQSSESSDAGAGFNGKPPTPRRKPLEHEAEARPEQPAGSLDPDHIVGADFDAVRALLGDPALELEEPPAKVWAYNGGSCMFNVFFFPSVEDNVYRVLTYEVTGPVTPAADGQPPNPLSPATIKIKDPTHPALQECFDELLRNRTAPSSEAQ